MKSTGEVMGIANDFPASFAKSQIAAGTNIPSTGNVFISMAHGHKQLIVDPARQLISLGFKILATAGTARVLQAAGLQVETVAQAPGRSPEPARLHGQRRSPADLQHTQWQGSSHRRRSDSCRSGHERSARASRLCRAVWRWSVRSSSSTRIPLPQVKTLAGVGRRTFDTDSELTPGWERCLKWLSSLRVCDLRSPIDPGMWLLCLGCLSMGGLLLPVFWAGPLALDEHVSYWMLDSEQPGSVLSRCLEYGAVPPLGSWLQYGSMGLFGKNESALRLPSLVAAGLSLVVVFRIGQQGGGSGSEGGSLCGGVAACLLAWHPDVLDEVRIGRCYGLVVCLSTCLVWTTLRWRENVNSWSRSLIWGLSATGLFWTHYTTAILVGVTWGFLVLSVVRSGSPESGLGNLTVATLLIGVLCLPLWPAVLRLREWSPYLNMLAPETPSGRQFPASGGWHYRWEELHWQSLVGGLLVPRNIV